MCVRMCDGTDHQDKQTVTRTCPPLFFLMVCVFFYFIDLRWLSCLFGLAFLVNIVPFTHTYNLHLFCFLSSFLLEKPKETTIHGE